MAKFKLSLPIGMIAIIIDSKNISCRKDLRNKISKLLNRGSATLAIHELEKPDQVFFERVALKTKPVAIIYFELDGRRVLHYQKEIKTLMNGSTPKDQYGIALKNHEVVSLTKHFRKIEDLAA